MASDSIISISLILMLSLIGQALAKCNTCETNSNTACHNRTAFSICLDGETSEDFIICPSGYHCTNGQHICYEETQGTPDCESDDNGTTTPTTPLDAQTFCLQAEKAGKYKNEYDKTCKSYYDCSNAQTYRISTCPSGLYFDGKICTADRPTDCIEQSV